MNMTMQEAEKLKVYRIRFINKPISYEVNGKKFSRNMPVNAEIEEVSFSDHVLESQETCTSPIGIMGKYFTKNNCLCTWEGQNCKEIEEFETEEESQSELFRRIYEYDFLEDDRRDTWYTKDYTEAEKYLMERLSDIWNVDIPVVVSILNHQKIADRIKANNEKKEIERRNSVNVRINQLVAVYSNMIESQKETFKETAQRLSGALNGERIEDSVFWATVKMIRSKYKKNKPK